MPLRTCGSPRDAGESWSVYIFFLKTAIIAGVLAVATPFHNAKKLSGAGMVTEVATWINV